VKKLLKDDPSIADRRQRGSRARVEARNGGKNVISDRPEAKLECALSRAEKRKIEEERPGRWKKPKLRPVTAL